MSRPALHVLTLLALLAAAPASAQLQLGAISGVVLDDSGLVIPQVAGRGTCVSTSTKSEAHAHCECAANR